MKNYTVVPFDTENYGLLAIGYLYQPEGEGPFDCAIMCHGIYDDLNNNTDIAEALAAQGMVVVNFDFNDDSGLSQVDGKVTDKAISIELKDLEAVIEKAKQIPTFKNIYLIGINQGGLISALAAKDEENDVNKLVLMYPSFDENSIKEIEGFKNPTLIFHGKKDPTVSVDYIEKAAQIYSNCNLIQVDHSVDNQARKSTINDIIDFLSK